MSLFSARMPKSTSPRLHGGKRISIGRAFSLVASLTLSAGVLTVLGVGAGVGVGTAAAATPTIVPIGGTSNGSAPPLDRHGAALATLAVNPQNVGDAFVLGVRIGTLATPDTVTVATVSGGGAGASWTKLQGDSTDGVHDVELWIGTIATTGASDDHSHIFRSGWCRGRGTYRPGVFLRPGSNDGMVQGLRQLHHDASSTTVTFPTIAPGWHERTLCGLCRGTNAVPQERQPATHTT